MTFRLHLESRRGQPTNFHLDERAWADATARHADLANQVDVSFGWDGAELPRALETADGLLASKFDKASVNAAPRLKWIHTTGAGVDQFTPLDDFRADLMLTNSSGLHASKAGESALMALLMLNARMPEIAANQHRHVWKSLLTSPIAGKRVVIVGFGDIGQSVARSTLAVGVQVVAVSRSGRRGPDAPDVPVLKTADLDQALPSADFLVVTAPLTPETRGLISEARLALLPPSAGIVNMARAGLVDYAALVRRLREGKLAGAVLDVFDGEPLASEAVYWDVPGLIVTPHVTCDPPDYNQRVLDIWFDNFARLQTGAPMRNQVDRARGY
jgi:phosphoglycerate dehydrogenase-like enzyme